MLTASASAFEKSGSAAGVPAPTDKTVDLSTNKKAIDAEDSGSVVRIPGLGALGVLPKLDFGLELLYGDDRPDVVTREKEDGLPGLQLDGWEKIYEEQS